MKHWLTTRWPADPTVIAATPTATLFGTQDPGRPEPGDKVMICRFQPDWDVLPDEQPGDLPLTEQWPRPEGMVVVGLVIEPPDDDGKRRPLCIGRDPNCWIRILEMRLPNYDSFDPEPDILTAIGFGDDQGGTRSRTVLTGLIRLTDEQFSRVLLTFSQRRDKP